VSRGATRDRLGSVNRAMVLSAVSKYGPISRADLSRRLELSAATVTSVTQALISDGIVSAREQEASRGGRPGTLLGIVGEAAAAVGVKVAEERMVGTLVDLDGTVLTTFEERADLTAGNPLQILVDALRSHVEDAQRHHHLLGLGIGLPGSNDPQHPGIVTSPLLDWHELPIGDHLTRALGLPVVLDNDVNTLAVAESLYGIGARYDSFVTLTLGRGVGLGIVVDGDLVSGSRGAAGELGHVTVDPTGVTCECGKRGCLETVVADRGLLRTARSQGLDVAGPEALLAAADAGNAVARSVYGEAGTLLGSVLANVTTVLDPAALLVSGEGSRAWHHMETSFRVGLQGGQMPSQRDRVAVVRDEWDDDKWALGAAALVLRAAFGTPLGATGPVEAVQARLGGNGRS
jgi:predicted NBD/HSP70 family sugar kinase